MITQTTNIASPCGAKVPMPIDELRRLFRVDFETGDIFRLTNTRGARAGDPVFQHVNRGGYKYFLIGSVRRSRVSSHRAIWAMAFGYWPMLPIDHLDRNPGNNRLVNLRECQLSQNSVNRDCPPGSTSQYRGVSWHKGHSIWRATIKVRGKCYHVGSFASEVDAARAYDARALAEFGQFAVLNFSSRKAA